MGCNIQNASCHWVANPPQGLLWDGELQQHCCLLNLLTTYLLNELVHQPLDFKKCSYSLFLFVFIFYTLWFIKCGRKLKERKHSIHNLNCNCLWTFNKILSCVRQLWGLKPISTTEFQISLMPSIDFYGVNSSPQNSHTFYAVQILDTYIMYIISYCIPAS